MAATGHDAGEWVVVTEAGVFSEGLKELQCTKDGTVLESEVIPQTFPLPLGAVVAIVIGVVAVAGGVVVVVKKKSV